MIDAVCTYSLDACSPLNRRGMVQGGLALVAALVFLGACGKQDPSASQPPPSITVKTSIAQNVAIPDETEYLATLKSRHSTTLNPQVEGFVTEIFVKSGDHVKAGKTLMEIDPLKQQATLKSQEAERLAQESNVAYAKVQFERTKELYDAGIVAKQDLDQAQTTYDAADKQLESLQAQVSEQRVELHYYSVVAPTDGIVGDIPVRVGDRVTNTTLLTTVDEPGSLEAYISVPVENEDQLKMGLPVELLDPTGAVIGKTAIDFISPQTDPSTQSVLVKASVSNREDLLRTAQFARARIIWGTHEGPTIPVLAVSRINGQYFGFVAESSSGKTVARQKMLKLGQLIGNSYAVLDGIKAGDHVIVEGTQILVDGMPVTESSANANAPAGVPHS
ncbi:MAG: efflux RND transporter periplasmic adaptor subunit [Candidatus Acidiferrales bacterium]